MDDDTLVAPCRLCILKPCGVGEDQVRVDEVLADQARQLDGEEHELHAIGRGGVEAIFSSKRFLLFDTMMEAARYDDTPTI